MGYSMEQYGRNSTLKIQDQLVVIINVIRTAQSEIDLALDKLNDCDLSGLDGIDSLTEFDLCAYTASTSLAQMNAFVCGWAVIVANEALKVGSVGEDDGDV